MLVIGLRVIAVVTLLVISSPSKAAMQSCTRKKCQPIAPCKLVRGPVCTPKKIIKKSRTITVHNDIVPASTTYTYFLISYPTTKFKLHVNGKKIKKGKSLPISVTDNKMVVRYTYEFANGKRRGAKEVTFELDPKASNSKITFSWNNEWRIIASSATPTKVKELYKK